jgi:hypothetical protein
MKSPFPGMDPYIEARGLWGDFHPGLIGEIHRALAAVVPDHYLVRHGERSYVVLAEEEGKVSHPFLPDVGVTSPMAHGPAPPPRSATAVVEPAAEEEVVSMRAFIAEEHRESFIEIYEADPEVRLVTCLEVLSPSNKRRGTEGWDLYLRKRHALMLGAANLVEIDLLRGGERFPMLDPWPNSPYALLVARKERSPYCRVWRGSFCKPLPGIPVPLSRPDPDVSLDLQPMIEAIYARSRYYRSIDYSKPLPPPLSPEEAAWLKQHLPSKTTAAKPKPTRSRRGRRS